MRKRIDVDDIIFSGESMKRQKFFLTFAWAFLSAGLVLADVDLPTKFTNQGSIGNTRHNMTQRPASLVVPSGAIMDPYRNDYQEVCVYCHTPHAARCEYVSGSSVVESHDEGDDISDL